MRSLSMGIVVSGLAACGSQNLLDQSSTNSSPAPNPETQETTVKADTKLGTQCPFGSFKDPSPIELQLWDCPIKLQEAEFTTSPESLVFQADCVKKVMTVRSVDKKIDVQVEIKPDNTFAAITEGGGTVLKSDGAGNSSCTAFMQLDIRGKIDCSDRDHAVIDVNSFWWPTLGTRPFNVDPRTITPCKMPSTCYFHNETKLQQCS